MSIEDVTAERNKLLHYLLSHPPANVSVEYVENAKKLDDVDLATCPLPLDTFEKALANPSQNVTLKVGGHYTYTGGSSGEVKRRPKSQSSPNAGEDSVHSTGAGAAGEPVADDASSAETSAQISSAGATGAPTDPSSPMAKQMTSVPESKKSPSPGVSASASPPPAASATEKSPAQKRRTSADDRKPEGGGGLSIFSSWFSAFKSNANSTDESGAANHNHHAKPAGSPATKQPQQQQQSTEFRGFRSLFGSREKKVEPAKPAEEEEEKAKTEEPLPSQRPLIPIHGTTGGLLIDNVKPRMRVADPPRNSIAEFPRPQDMELCPLFDTSALNDLSDVLFTYVYEHILLAAKLLLGSQKTTFEREIFSIYRPFFEVSDEEHMRCMSNLISPEIYNIVHQKDCPPDIRLRYIENIQPTESLLQSMINSSEDEEFVSRMRLLIDTCKTYADSPQGLDLACYPLIVRASLYAGCLMPLYRLDNAGIPFASKGDISTCVMSMQRMLQIPPEIDQYCHLHARILSSPDSQELGAQCAFLRSVTVAVSQLQTEVLGNMALTPSVKYQFYVLQETLSIAMAPMPWLDTVAVECVKPMTALYMETCLSLPSAFLCAFVFVNGKCSLTPATPTSVFMQSFLSFFIDASTMRSMFDIGARLNVQKGSLNNLFSEVRPFFETAKRYCNMIHGSLPFSHMLAVPARMHIGAYVLAVHWGIKSDDMCGTMEVPADLEEGVTKLLEFISENAMHTPTENRDLSQVLRQASYFFLGRIEELVRRYDNTLFASIGSAVREGVNAKWDDQEGYGAHAALVALVHQHVCKLVIPPLGSRPEEMYTKRVTKWSEEIEFILNTIDITPPVPDTSRSLPGPCAQYRLVLLYKKHVRPTIREIIQRLNTLSGIQQECAQYFGKLTQEYDRICDVTGAPPALLLNLWTGVDKACAEVEKNLCEWLSACMVLEPKLYAMLTEQFMRIDYKNYKQVKKKSKTSLDHYPLLYPEVTMATVLELVESSYTNAAERLVRRRAKEEVHLRTGSFIVGMLYATYVEGENVFLTPEDAKDISTDLNLVEATFFQIGSNDASIDDFGKSEGVQEAEQLLQELRSIVTLVLSQSSTDLINGTNGVPPMNTLPEYASHSPWCKYVLRHVLERRKDKFGVSGMAVYAPPCRVDLKQWCEWTGNSWDKVSNVVGHSFRIPTPNENAYTMAANAVLRLIVNNNIDPKQIGFLGLGTESSSDNSAGAIIVKGMVDKGLEAMGLPAVSRHCEVPEFKHACLGGVYAMESAVRFASADGGDRVAIAVASDIAEYALGSTGEQTQGAGATALLVESKPRLFEVQLKYSGSASDYRGPDFRKPHKRHFMNLEEYNRSSEHGKVADFPVFSGPYSTLVYQEEVTVAVEHMLERLGQAPGKYYDDVTALFFHRPYNMMPIQAMSFLYARGLARATSEEHKKRFADLCAAAKVKPEDVIAELDVDPRYFKQIETGDEPKDAFPNTGKVSRVLRKEKHFMELLENKMSIGSPTMANFGNLYTASLPCWLAAGFEEAYQKKLDIAGKPMVMVGYGSGDASMSIPIVPVKGWEEAASKIHVGKALENPLNITKEQYESLHTGREKTDIAHSHRKNEFVIERLGSRNEAAFQDVGIEYYKYVA